MLFKITNRTFWSCAFQPATGFVLVVFFSQYGIPNRLKFKFTYTVRGSELDQFSRARNSAYLNYFEQARWELLQRSGTFDYFSDNEILPAIIEIGIRYESEARIFDELEVATTIRLDAPYFVFDQVMSNVTTGLRCSTAMVKQLLVDTREKVAFEVPGEILEKWGL